MPITLAFDVYGTLIDTHGVVAKLEELIGAQAKSFSLTWREKQLEYSFRRGLMQMYENFTVCTSQALDYTCALYNLELSRKKKQELLDFYRTLPAYLDAQEGLEDLTGGHFHCFAFSNGSAEAVETLLRTAGILDYFKGVVSVDEIKSFKPDPAVYRHFLRSACAAVDDAWMISSNPFDVIGALSAGMRAAWVRRSQNVVYDPWGIDPTITVESLGELRGKILNTAF